MKNKFVAFFKKARWAVPAFAASLPSLVHAEGETVPDGFQDALNDLEDGVTAMIDKVVPTVSAILVALLVFVGLFMAWRYVKKAAK